MNLKRIQEQVGKFHDYLRTSKDFPTLPIWESQRLFQETWDINAPDFGNMYDQSLQNTTTRRLWKAQAYEPKAMMLQLIEQDAEFVRMMFKDLLNESKQIDGRIDRFLFHCDQLSEIYSEKHPTALFTEHFHRDGYRMVSLYLTFAYPEQYAYYSLSLLQKTLKDLQAPKLPPTHDIERYFKVLRTLYRFLEKEPDLWEAHQARLDPRRHYTGPSLLLAFEFARFISQELGPF
jgi:hypothetical protein